MLGIGGATPFRDGYLWAKWRSFVVLRDLNVRDFFPALLRPNSAPAALRWRGVLAGTTASSSPPR